MTWTFAWITDTTRLRDVASATSWIMDRTVKSAALAPRFVRL